MMNNGTTKNALHLATHSGWYRFEQREESWIQVDRALTYWLMTCIQVDPDNPKRVYLGTEHSGLFVTNDGGKDWIRANPNVPCLTISSLLALPGKLLAGTMPAALYLNPNGSGWQELEGVRPRRFERNFPTESGVERSNTRPHRREWVFRSSLRRHRSRRNTG